MGAVLPVLRPTVVQPADPASEAEDGVEGAFQAVQCPLCRQRGQHQAMAHPTALLLAKPPRG